MPGFDARIEGYETNMNQQSWGGFENMHDTIEHNGTQQPTMWGIWLRPNMENGSAIYGQVLNAENDDQT